MLIMCQAVIVIVVIAIFFFFRKKRVAPTGQTQPVATPVYQVPPGALPALGQYQQVPPPAPLSSYPPGTSPVNNRGSMLKSTYETSSVGSPPTSPGLPYDPTQPQHHAFAGGVSSFQSTSPQFSPAVNSQVPAHQPIHYEYYVQPTELPTDSRHHELGELGG